MVAFSTGSTYLAHISESTLFGIKLVLSWYSPYQTIFSLVIIFRSRLHQSHGTNRQVLETQYYRKRFQSSRMFEV